MKYHSIFVFSSRNSGTYALRPPPKVVLSSITGLSSYLDKLTCNEVKMSRLGQLRRALANYVPDDDPIVEKVILKRKDAASLEQWDDIAVYDKVNFFGELDNFESYYTIWGEGSPT